jgi:Big-like domain-containing protein
MITSYTWKAPFVPAGVRRRQYLVPDTFFFPYTVTVEPVGDLSVQGYKATTNYQVTTFEDGSIAVSPASDMANSFSFNSSNVTYNSAGAYAVNYLVLSTRQNVPPTPPGLPYSPLIGASSRSGSSAGPYVVLAGGTLPEDTDDNGDPLGDISANGVLQESGDLLFPYQLNNGWYQPPPYQEGDPEYDPSDPGNAPPPVQILFASLSTANGDGPTLGTVQVNANGSFLYTASQNAWGQDFYRIVVRDASGHMSLKATMYVTVGTPFVAPRPVVKPTEKISTSGLDPSDPGVEAALKQRIKDQIHADASTRVILQDSFGIQANTLGISGLVVAIKGNTTIRSGGLNLRSIKIEITPWYAVFSEITQAQRVKVGVRNGEDVYLPGPTSVANHEYWHTDGVLRGFSTKAYDLGFNLTPRRGYRYGAEQQISAFGGELRQSINNSGTPQQADAVVDALVDKYFSGAGMTAMLIPGLWHKVQTEDGVDVEYDSWQAR